MTTSTIDATRLDQNSIGAGRGFENIETNEHEMKVHRVSVGFISLGIVRYAMV